MLNTSQTNRTTPNDQRRDAKASAEQYPYLAPQEVILRFNPLRTKANFQSPSPGPRKPFIILNPELISNPTNQSTHSAPKTNINSDEELELFIIEETNKVSAITSEAVEIPKLTDNLVTDIRNFTGLTTRELAELFNRTERTIHQWRTGTIPETIEPALNTLLMISLSLIGGLGPKGVRRWLFAGKPSRYDQIRNGDIEQVTYAAKRLEDSPAT